MQRPEALAKNEALNSLITTNSSDRMGISANAFEVLVTQRATYFKWFRRSYQQHQRIGFFKRTVPVSIKFGNY